MKWFGIIAMTLLMTMTGCKKEMGTQYRGCSLRTGQDRKSVVS